MKAAVISEGTPFVYSASNFREGRNPVIALWHVGSQPGLVRCSSCNLEIPAAEHGNGPAECPDCHAPMHNANGVPVGALGAEFDLFDHITQRIHARAS